MVVENYQDLDATNCLHLGNSLKSGIRLLKKNLACSSSSNLQMNCLVIVMENIILRVG